MATPDSLTDFLERNDIPYIKRKVKSYIDAGSRVNIPKDWKGNVIIIPERYNHARVLNDLLNELKANIDSCIGMRQTGRITTLPCSAIDDSLYERVGRNNDVCRRCAFGIRIEYLTKAIEATYDAKTDRRSDGSVNQKLAEQYFEEKEV
jgi:hypothetical protein